MDLCECGAFGARMLASNDLFGVPTVDIIAALVAGFAGLLLGFAVVMRIKQSRARREPFFGVVYHARLLQLLGKTQAKPPLPSGGRLEVEPKHPVIEPSRWSLNKKSLAAGMANPLRISRGAIAGLPAAASMVVLLASLVGADASGADAGGRRLQSMSNSSIIEAAEVAAVAFLIGIVAGGALALCVKVYPGPDGELPTTSASAIQQQQQQPYKPNDDSASSMPPSPINPPGPPFPHRTLALAAAALAAEKAAGGLSHSPRSPMSGGFAASAAETVDEGTYRSSEGGLDDYDLARMSSDDLVLLAAAASATARGSPLLGPLSAATAAPAAAAAAGPGAYAPTMNPALQRWESVRRVISKRQSELDGVHNAASGNATSTPSNVSSVRGGNGKGKDAPLHRSSSPVFNNSSASSSVNNSLRNLPRSTSPFKAERVLPVPGPPPAASASSPKPRSVSPINGPLAMTAAAANGRTAASAHEQPAVFTFEERDGEDGAATASVRAHGASVRLGDGGRGSNSSSGGFAASESGAGVGLLESSPHIQQRMGYALDESTSSDYSTTRKYPGPLSPPLPPPRMNPDVGSPGNVIGIGSSSTSFGSSGASGAAVDALALPPRPAEPSSASVVSAVRAAAATIESAGSASVLSTPSVRPRNPDAGGSSGGLKAHPVGSTPYAGGGGTGGVSLSESLHLLPPPAVPPRQHQQQSMMDGYAMHVQSSSSGGGHAAAGDDAADTLPRNRQQSVETGPRSRQHSDGSVSAVIGAFGAYAQQQQAVHAFLPPSPTSATPSLPAPQQWPPVQQLQKYGAVSRQIDVASVNPAYALSAGGASGVSAAPPALPPRGAVPGDGGSSSTTSSSSGQWPPPAPGTTRESAVRTALSADAHRRAIVASNAAGATAAAAAAQHRREVVAASAAATAASASPVKKATLRDDSSNVGQW